MDEEKERCRNEAPGDKYLKWGLYIAIALVWLTLVINLARGWG